MPRKTLETVTQRLAIAHRNYVAAQAAVVKTGAAFRKAVADASEFGVNKASIARLVDVSRTRIDQMIRQAKSE